MNENETIPSDPVEGVPDMIKSEPNIEPVVLDPVIQAHIGRELRALFDKILDEPVPDRFTELLLRLENKKMDPA